MDGLSRVGPGNRVGGGGGGGLLRNRSQEWARQDSSSDNEDDLRSSANAKAAAHNMNLNGMASHHHQHEYEEPRNVIEARKISLGKNRLAANCAPRVLLNLINSEFSGHRDQTLVQMTRKINTTV